MRLISSGAVGVPSLSARIRVVEMAAEADTDRSVLETPWATNTDMEVDCPLWWRW